MPLCDIVLVALKTTANHLLSDILPHVVKPDGTVVVLQNGRGVEQAVQQILPGATILGGLCFLCSNKTGPGHIRHLDFGSVRIGEYREDGSAAGITPALKKVADLFGQAGIAVDTTDNLGLARWQKLVWNMAYNGVAAVLGATTEQLMANQSTLGLVRAIMEEVVAGARSDGYDLSYDFIETMLRTTAKMVAYSPSMKLDCEAGRPLETETIYWRPIRAARENGVNMPHAETIARQLDFIDQQNRSH
jgi:2-dehydropantoate 2-reductase